MTHVQTFFYFVGYLLAAKACLCFLPGRWRIAVFGILNITAIWVLVYPAFYLTDRNKFILYLAYLALVVFQFLMLTWFVERPGWRPWLAFFTPLAALVALKYVPHLNIFWRVVGWHPFSLTGNHFIGISYLAFRASKLVLDVRNGVVKRPGFWEYLAFCFFLPTMSVGPINSYSNFQKGFGPTDRAALPLGRCALRILVGLIKFLVLAHICYQFSYGGLLLDGHPHRWVELPIAAGFYYLYLYCNFSGFCDIAIGLAGLLGFLVEENFNNPFASRNIQDFWNRWHMTLSRYMRDVLFTPLSKKLAGVFGLSYINAAIAVSTVVVFLLIGIWHGVGWNYLAFGAANALGLVVVHYYGIGLKKWLGKEGFKRYLQNGWIRTLATVITFAYVAACLGLFANNFSTWGNIFSELK